MASHRKKKTAPAKQASTTRKGGREAGLHAVEELDACDLAFDEAETTPDEDLPAAEGGVA